MSKGKRVLEAIAKYRNEHPDGPERVPGVWLMSETGLGGREFSTVTYQLRKQNKIIGDAHEGYTVPAHGDASAVVTETSASDDAYTSTESESHGIADVTPESDGVAITGEVTESVYPESLPRNDRPSYKRHRSLEIGGVDVLDPVTRKVLEAYRRGIAEKLRCLDVILGTKGSDR